MNKKKINKFFDKAYTTSLKLFFFFGAVYFSSIFWASLFQAVREDSLLCFGVSVGCLLATSILIGLTWIFEWFSIDEEKTDAIK
jgi:hypothetical protein